MPSSSVPVSVPFFLSSYYLFVSHFSLLLKI
nr:MAG TPA: hypothetical protein [Caudoviricetes sp.]